MTPRLRVDERATTPIVLALTAVAVLCIRQARRLLDLARLVDDAEDVPMEGDEC